MKNLSLENKALLLKKVEYTKKSKIETASNEKYAKLKELFTNDQTEFSDEELSSMVSCLENRFKKSEKFTNILV